MSEPDKRHFRIPPRVWVGLALAAVALAFVLQNRTTTTIELFWMTMRAPLWLALLAMLIVGWIIGRLTGMRRR